MSSPAEQLQTTLLSIANQRQNNNTALFAYARARTTLRTTGGNASVIADFKAQRANLDAGMRALATLQVTRDQQRAQL